MTADRTGWIPPCRGSPRVEQEALDQFKVPPLERHLLQRDVEHLGQRGIRAVAFGEELIVRDEHASREVLACCRSERHREQAVGDVSGEDHETFDPTPSGVIRLKREDMWRQTGGTGSDVGHRSALMMENEHVGQ